MAPLRTALVVLSTLALVACGGDDRRGGGGSGGGSGGGGGGGAAAGGGAGGGGAPADQSSSGSVAIASSDPAAPAVNDSPSAETASKDTFGAWLLEGRLHMYVLSDAYTLSFDVDASGGLPASFAFSGDTDHIGTYLNASGATGCQATGGALTVSGCADSEGEVVSGTYDSITFDCLSATGQETTETLTGDFRTVLVEVVNGGVTCPEDTTGGGDAGGGDGGGGGACEWGPDNTCLSEGQAPCCPWSKCLGECMAGCDSSCLSDNPADIGACMQCMMGCETECPPGPTCEPYATAMMQCSSDNGCDEMEDEAETACQQSNCCDEFGAALGHN